MALETLRKLWKNEYFQTAITVILLLAFVFGFWYVTQTVLRTGYPALAVASTSMLPTLNVGDLIIVQGVPPEQINANYLTGDIVVFTDAKGDLIVHRAVKVENISGEYWFTTKGDNVPGSKDQFSPWPASRLVGKVVGRIPWIGNFALLMHSQQNIYLFTVVIIILIVVVLFFPFETDEEEKESGEKLVLGKMSLKMVYLIILNIILIGFIIFSLWGTFTFWNPGAGSNSQGMTVTIYGMFSDVNFHEAHPNNVLEALLSQGFLTYTINCRLSEGLRTGVPTFSWAQAAIIVLLVYDVWELTKFLQKRKKMVEA
ncbi:signal peptidase I [Candidatus Bathyarchaeota archaeon]|nr:MAG: signal peptidase I [Candidatus Bathyarchaeota archaeon]